MSKVQQLTSRLHGGLIPAVPVPRNEAGAVHAEAQRTYADYLCRQNIAGVAVWVHTGRGLHLSDQERSFILKSWKSRLRPEQVLIAGVGANILNNPASGQPDLERWRRDRMLMAEQAVLGGADALLIFPPVIFKGLESGERHRAIIEYHREIGALGVPLFLFYLYEDAGGLAYSKETLRELLAFPEVAGIKMAALDSVMTLQEVASLVRTEFPDKLLVTGEDRMFGYSLMCGATCALVGLGAAFPNIQSDLISAYFNQDYARFMDLSSRVDAYAQATFTPPMDQYILRMLHVLSMDGVIPQEAAFDLPETAYRLKAPELNRLYHVIKQNRLY